MKNLITLAAILLSLAVMFGAFGAHALDDVLDAYGKEIYEKAAFYHFIHALGILLIALLAEVKRIPEQVARKISLTMTLGIVLFSGSLYALAITGISKLGMITPFGGSLFIICWLWLAIKSRKP